MNPTLDSKMSPKTTREANCRQADRDQYGRRDLTRQPRKKAVQLDPPTMPIEDAATEHKRIPCIAPIASDHSQLARSVQLDTGTLGEPENKLEEF